MPKLLLALPVFLICWSCSQRPPATLAPDPSGLSAEELSTALPEPREMTREENEAMKKGSAHFSAKLAACPNPGLAEWRRRVDTLKPGMFLSQVRHILPGNSVSGASLWTYPGILPNDIRQTHLWALDSEFAVAVEEDFSGSNLWEAEGSPKPRLLRHENRITARPVLLRHKGRLTDWGSLDRADCSPL